MTSWLQGQVVGSLRLAVVQGPLNMNGLQRTGPYFYTALMQNITHIGKYIKHTFAC